MRNLIAVILFVALTTGLSFVSAQTPPAQERAASLRLQLVEVETRQADLQKRLAKLEEDMKPENIEKNFAGIGSTKPEDLREQRRRQLEAERNGVKTQLDLLTTSHTRLEAAIARADAEAYRQSASPVVTPATETTAGTGTSVDASAAPAPVRPRRVRKKARRLRRAKASATTME